MTKFKLVLCRQDDIEQVFNLAFAETDELLRKAWGTPSYDWKGWKEDLERTFLDETEHVFNIEVAGDKEKDQIIGFVWYNISEGESLWLTSLVLRKDFQGKGIGSRILFMLEEEALRNGLRVIELGVQKLNKVALEFYRRNGFQEGEDLAYAGTILMQKHTEQKIPRR